MSIETVYCLIPELVLIVTATLIYVAGALVGGRQFWSWMAAGGLILAAVALGQQYHQLYWPDPGATGPLLSVEIAGPLAGDLLSQYIRWLALVVGLLFVLLGWRAAADVQVPEYLGTLLMALAGLMLVGSARDLVLLFVALELISIPTYVLLYLGRRDMASQEATLKYFFLSILSSALMLYGFSFLYGVAGSTRLETIYTAVLASGAESSSGLLFGRLALVLIFAGLAFKIAAVPFHFYAPDVYQGTTHGNAGLLAVLPKIAGFVALLRVVAVAMPGFEVLGWRLSLILAVLTMTVGNVLALWQDNIRRLLAYSSIAHAGYMLIGLAVGFAVSGGANSATNLDGIGAMLFYLSVYCLATIGTFAALVYLGQADKQIDGVDELAGLGRTHPLAGLAVALFMFSLAGIPPLAGFWGKLTLFSSALAVDAGGAANPLRTWFVGLAVVGVLNAAVAAGYYLRIVAVMYFRAPLSTLPALGGAGARAAMVLCLVLVVAVGLLPGPLLLGSNAASQAARSWQAAADVADATRSTTTLTDRAAPDEGSPGVVFPQ